jgi:hypothetical protein
MVDRTPIIGVFISSRQAGWAVHELRRAGFLGGQIQVVARDEDGTGGRPRARVRRGTRTTETPPGDAVHAVLAPGQAARQEEGGPGLLAADTSPTVSGVVGGVLDTVRQAAAAAADAVTGTLADMGFLGDEAAFYEGECRAGSTLVAVRVRRRDEAAAILRRCGAYDAQHPRRGEQSSGSGKSPRQRPARRRSGT